MCVCLYPQIFKTHKNPEIDHKFLAFIFLLKYWCYLKCVNNFLLLLFLRGEAQNCPEKRPAKRCEIQSTGSGDSEERSDQNLGQVLPPTLAPPSGQI